MARSKTDQILQLKVTLAEVEPPVWRRLLVPADMTLAKLHGALQAATGWTNSHLHCFEIPGRRIGMVGVEEDSPELEDEHRVRVASVLPKKGAKLVYRYDYGDDWEHVIEVEDVTVPDRRLAYPLCIGGGARMSARGLRGRRRVREPAQRPRVAGTRRARRDAHVGRGHFDPDSFDTNAVNRLYRYGG
jgi:hypothetical protein